MLRILIASLLFSSVSAQVMNVRKWRQTEKDSLENALAMVDEQYFLYALPIFEQLLQNHPNEQFLQYSYGKCALQRGDKQHEAYDLLAPVYNKTKKLPDLQFDLALAAFYKLKYDESLDLLNQYEAGKKVSPENKQNASRLRSYIAAARTHLSKPASARVSLMGEAVNSEYDEKFPSLVGDGSNLLFTYSGKRSLGGLQPEDLGEDIQCSVYRNDVLSSRRRNKRYSEAVHADSVNTFSDEQLCGISPDGRTLLLHIDIGDGHGDIYESHFNGSFYQNARPLKGEINSYHRELSACLAPDGNTIYFSSDRPGGKGGLDLYMATLNADSTWTNVRNLGEAVNSAADEDCPFIAADGRTLFFSSRGWNSLGGYDVFRSKRSDTLFSTPVHLGHPVNHTSDDVGFVLAPDGKTAYFSSARKEGLGMNDIFQVLFDNNSGSEPVLLLSGNVSEGQRKVSALVTVDKDKLLAASQMTLATDSVSGNYLLCLPARGMHTLSCSAPGMRTSTVVIDTRSLVTYQEKRHDFNMRALAAEPLAIAGVSLPVQTATAPATVKKEVAAPSATVIAIVRKDNFEPQNLLQKKTVRFLEQNAGVAAPGLEFYVQFAALKGEGNLYQPALSKVGRIGRLRLNDGYTRLTVGGKFSTLAKAFVTNKKAVKAGQKDSFVIAVYKGRRVTFEELQTLKIFK